jgi:hypothetical protein
MKKPDDFDMPGELLDDIFPPDPYAHLSDQVVMLTTETDQVDMTANRPDQVNVLTQPSHMGERATAHAQRAESLHTVKKFDLTEFKFESSQTGEIVLGTP